MSAAAEAPVTLLPREVRMVVERMLLLTRLPQGAVPAVRDVVLYSAAAGLGGLPLLRSRFETLRQADPAAPGVTGEAEGPLRIDARGQHAWMVLPVILDLLGEAAFRRGEARAVIEGVTDAEELGVAAAMAPRLGLSIAVDGATLTATPADGAAEDRALDAALRRGVPVEAELWWELHHLSNTALATDTPESRRHAGPVIVEADGRVIGRSDHDDDTDLSLLTEAKPPAAVAS